MGEVSERLASKIEQSFPRERVDEVISLLSGLPEPAGSEERIQAAMIVKSRGSFEAFLSELKLVQLDWRDTLMYSGFEHETFPAELDRVLGPVQTPSRPRRGLRRVHGVRRARVARNQPGPPEYPDLAAFLGGYFHEDWRADEPRDEAVIEEALASSDSERLREVTADIAMLLGRHWSDAQLNHWLVANHRLHDPPWAPDGNPTQWLASLAETLARDERW